MRQRVASIDRRERMRKAVDFHHGDVVIAQQIDHVPHEAGDEQRDVAARHVGDSRPCRARPSNRPAGPPAGRGLLARRGSRSRPPATRAATAEARRRRRSARRRWRAAGRRAAAWSRRQTRRSRLRRPHPRRLPAAQDDPAGVHRFVPLQLGVFEVLAGAANRRSTISPPASKPPASSLYLSTVCRNEPGAGRAGNGSDLPGPFTFGRPRALTSCSALSRAIDLSRSGRSFWSSCVTIAKLYRASSSEGSSLSAAL